MEDATRPLVGWRSLAEAVPGGVAIQRDGEFVYASPAVAEAVGVDPADLVGLPPARLCDPDAAERLRTALRSVRDGGEWEGVLRTSEAVGDGRQVDATISKAGVDEHSTTAGESLVWTFAEHSPAPGAHHGDLDRYETILDTIDDGVYALNADLEFTYVNDAVCALTERDRDELLGTNVVDLFTDEDERERAAAIRESVVDGEGASGTVEATVPTAAGERILEAHFQLSPRTDEEFGGSVGIVRDVTEIRRLERDLREEHRFLQNVVDALDDVLYVIDEDADFVFWNDVAVERTGYSDAEFAEIHPLTFASDMPADEAAIEAFDVTELPERYRLDLETKDGEVIPHELIGVTYRDEESDELYLVGVARDITEQLERKRELERQRDELATLDHINELVLETVQELLSTAGRETVERTVCERLTNSALYQFAWVGEPALADDEIVPRVIAGADRAYLESVTHTADDGATGQGPVGRAIRAGEVAVANVDDPAFAPWRDAARERGVESVLAVPLRHEGTVYGVLTVYANREDAFSTRERDAFDVLGRTVGFVLYATRSRELFFADEIVELEFAFESAEYLFGNAAPAVGADLELAGYVAADQGWILYVEVHDVDPHAVVDFAADDPEVDRVRVIHERPTGGRLEVAVADSDLLETVTAAGASVTSATATDDGARLVVEAPTGADVRDIVELVTRTYDSADLLARRERDREITTPDRPDGILGDLTDRQRKALETAYRAGYFDWPRGSTAEEVAETLSVAPATLHGHLRKAEKNVFRTLFTEQ